MACAISRRLRASHDGTVKEQGHDVTRRDVIELVSEMVDRGAPVAANKTLQMAKTFFTWCVGRAIIDRSPCEGVKQPTREIPRDRVLSDDELGRVIKAAREIRGPYGGIVELLALTAQRREEVAQMTRMSSMSKSGFGPFPAPERRTASLTSSICRTKR